jgi:hypothetical protein
MFFCMVSYVNCVETNAGTDFSFRFRLGLGNIGKNQGSCGGAATSALHLSSAPPLHSSHLLEIILSIAPSASEALPGPTSGPARLG